MATAHDHRLHEGQSLADAAQRAFERAGEQWTPMRAEIFAALSAATKPASAYDLAEAVSGSTGRRVAATAGVVRTIGPNLSHVGSRTTIVAGFLPNTAENLAKWLSNPDSVKPGTLMKLPRKLTDAEVATMVAFLRSHQ